VRAKAPGERGRERGRDDPAGRLGGARGQIRLGLLDHGEDPLGVRGQPTAGRIVATAFPTAAVAFAPALTRSLRTHPRLTLVLRQTAAREGMRQVRSGEVDVAIVDDWTSRLADDLDESILTSYHLIRDGLVLVVPRAHWAADSAQPVDLRALRDEPWLAAPAGEASRHAVDRLLGAAGVAPAVLSEFEGMSTIVSLVARGVGIAIVPRIAVSAGERRLVVRELPHGLDLARDILAVVRTASVRRPSVAVIVQSLRAAAKGMSAARSAISFPDGP
jgi:DNA-binding transcriptional LysR family regulator